MTFYRRHRSRRVPHGVDRVTSTVSAEGNAVLCFPPDGTFFRGLLTTREEFSTDDDSPYALYGRETPTPGQYKVTLADLETGTQYHLNSVQLRGKLRKTRETIKNNLVIKSDTVAIPINNHISTKISRSPNNFDNIFINESCPTFHEFHHEQRILKEDIDEDINNEEPVVNTCQTFEESISSSFSDDINDSSPINSIEIPKSMSGTTTSYSESPISPNDMNKESSPPQFSLESDDEQNVLQFTANSVFRGQKADMMIQQFMAGSKLVGSKCVVLTGPLRFCVNETPFATSGTMAWSL